MPKAVEVKLPNWAFEVAWKISELRSSRFKNRFRNKKLLKIHEEEPYSDHIESILGYLGDIGCAVLLGLDPKLIIEQMLIDTECLQHRDTHDLVYKLCNIDVKIEDYGSKETHKKIIEGTISPTETYGCRLINRAQWQENGENIDYYVFGTTDIPLSRRHKLHQVKSLWFIGFLSKKELEKYPFSLKTPAGKSLYTEAKIIPTCDLRDITSLRDIEPCNRTAKVIDRSKLENEDCQKILEQLRKLW